MKTYAPKSRDIESRWYLIDADGAVLGRLASEVAKILRGKHKPIFAPHADTGDHVVVVNAKGVRLTGGKDEKKLAYRHSGYPGGLTATPYGRLMAKRPAFAVEKAVRGMLPKNRLGRAMVKKLQVYEGSEHPHAAQKPVPLGLGEIPPWEGLPVPPEPEAVPTPAKKATTKRSAAKKSTAKRPTAKKSSAKKSTAKRSTAKKVTAKRSAAKKPTGKRSAAAKAETRVPKKGKDR